MEVHIIFYIGIYGILFCMLGAGVCLHAMSHVMLRDIFEFKGSTRSPFTVSVPVALAYLSMFLLTVMLVNPYSIDLIGVPVFQNIMMTIIVASVFILPTSAIYSLIITIINKRVIKDHEDKDSTLVTLTKEKEELNPLLEVKPTGTN